MEFPRGGKGRRVLTGKHVATAAGLKVAPNGDGAVAVRHKRHSAHGLHHRVRDGDAMVLSLAPVVQPRTDEKPVVREPVRAVDAHIDKVDAVEQQRLGRFAVADNVERQGSVDSALAVLGKVEVRRDVAYGQVIVCDERHVCFQSAYFSFRQTLGSRRLQRFAQTAGSRCRRPCWQRWQGQRQTRERPRQ